uniref:HMG box domain-containing protein n=1 Tax=Lotharella globosa TaxID=91324 RepID=A0A7S4DPL0_9EUKA
MVLYLDKPKKPKSPFFLFLDEFRAEHKNMEAKQMAGEAGKAWAALDEKKKTPYREKAAKLAEEYKAAMEKYNEKKSKTKSANKPKRPMSAFLYFMKDFRKKNEGKYNITEMVTMGSSAWNELSQKSKEKYEQLAAKAKEEYNEKLKEWDEKDWEE